MLKQKIKNKTVVVAILGLGHVGYPMSSLFAKNGFQTIGYDINLKRLEDIAHGRIISELDSLLPSDEFKRNKVVSEITGEYSSSEVDKKQGSVGFMVETDKVIGVVSGNYSKNDYSTQRGFPFVSHIPYSGRIINGSETTGKDMWGSGRVYYKASENFVPFIGGAYGKSQRDGVEEQGLTLTKRTIAESDETFKYAEGGVRLMYSISDFDLFGQVGRHATL